MIEHCDCCGEPLTSVQYCNRCTDADYISAYRMHPDRKIAIRKPMCPFCLYIDGCRNGRIILPKDTALVICDKHPEFIFVTSK